MARVNLVCPYCNTALRAYVEMRDVCLDEDVTTSSLGDWKQTLTTEQVNFVEQAKTNGLYAAFESVLTHMRGSAPTYPERFFVTFFRTAKPKRIPSFALASFMEKFGGHINFWSAQGIGLVTSDSRPVYFVPIYLVAGESLRMLGNSSNSKTRLTAESQPLEDWLRTRMGYCPRGSMLLDELRRKSIGEFANPVL